MIDLVRVYTFCLFYWPHDHRDLHSFPTRRSSDLDVGQPALVAHRAHLREAVALADRRPDPLLGALEQVRVERGGARDQDRKSTRLNSSHPSTSYAVFCLNKKRRADFVSVLDMIDL